VLDYLTSSLVTLLVVSDPLLLSAFFIGLTDGMTEHQRREVAWRGPLIAFIIRIAGGLLLLWSAWEMVFDRRSKTLETTTEMALHVDHVKNVAAFPLAIPLIAGPGAITAMILLAGRTEGQVDRAIGLFAVTALVMLACVLAFLGADRIAKVMGVTVRAVSTRMLGIILAALAVQFMVDGVLALLPD